jgi:hypothetical protein
LPFKESIEAPDYEADAIRRAAELNDGKVMKLHFSDAKAAQATAKRMYNKAVKFPAIKVSVRGTCISITKKPEASEAAPEKKLRIPRGITRRLGRVLKKEGVAVVTWRGSKIIIFSWDGYMVAKIRTQEHFRRGKEAAGVAEGAQ